MNERIQVGSKMMFIAKPEHYLSSTYIVGEVYEVYEISLYGENRVPTFKFKNTDNKWITDRFFEIVKED